MAKQDSFQPDVIDQTIRKNLPKLAKPGVLTVRPGYEITGDQLTGKQAIVATIHTKRGKSELPKADLLPDKIGEYPVDVREASAYQRLRVIDPVSAAVAMTYGRPEDREPDWPSEREMPGCERPRIADSTRLAPGRCSRIFLWFEREVVPLGRLVPCSGTEELKGPKIHFSCYETREDQIAEGC